jgi:hypothetical protein
MFIKTGWLLLSIVYLLAAQSQPCPASAIQASNSEIPTVSLCDLLSKPADYNGKEIRVRAQYHIGFEYSLFNDPVCKDYAIKSTPFWNGAVVWAEMDQSVKTVTKPEIYKKFRSLASLCCPDEWRDSEAELLVTGKFFKADDDKGYGHLGRYALQLVVDRIEAASAVEKSKLLKEECH